MLSIHRITDSASFYNTLRVFISANQFLSIFKTASNKTRYLLTNKTRYLLFYKCPEGLMMTPIIRPAIKRHVPLALIDAPKQGTGKGLLSDVISIIAIGESASILTAPTNDDEWDKRVTALLMS